MNRFFVMSAMLAASFPVLAQNLVQNGDFTNASSDLSPVCYPESGGVSIFTEDRTWNKCGMCKVTRSYPDKSKEGSVTHSATVVVGLDKDRRGFAVEPGVRYEVAFDVRGLDEAMKIHCDALCWKGDDYWKDRVPVKDVIKGGISAEKEWRTFKGSFRVPEGAYRAAVRLWITSSSRWKTHQFKIGDAFLFDNVKVTRSRNNVDLSGGDAVSDIPVVMRKTVTVGEPFSDFVSMKDGTVPDNVRMTVMAQKGAQELCLDLTAEDDQGCAEGLPEKVWSGDTIEIVLERKDGACSRTHIAFNNAGAKYTNAGEDRGNGDWRLHVEKKDGRYWHAKVSLPFSFLGISGEENELGVNVGRARAKARTFDCWSRGASFHDPQNFGRLLFVPYADELKHRFGIDSKAATRAAFESEWINAERVRLREKMERFRSAKFSFAPVSAISDWSVPYLPSEVFDPPSEICITGAVNEIRALPLAIANFSKRTEDYRVVIETAEKEHIGSWGLSGFPQEQIAARKGVRFKDVDTEDPSIRFDPLVKLDEAGTVTVPSREAGLVWYDFDCTGVRPGTYKGRLRIIPMCEPGVFRKVGYVGKMLTVPVSLTVVDAEIPTRPGRPSGFFMGVESKAALDMAFQIGTEHFQVHTWSIQYERDKDGNLDLSRPKKRCVDEFENIKNHVAWAAKHGFRPKFHVVYTAMEACKGMYCGKSREKFLRNWPQYVGGVKKLLNDAGVPDTDYFIEVMDEPKKERMDELLEAHKLAKASYPTVRLAMLLAAWKPTVEKMQEFVPYADVWILWKNGYWADGAYRNFAAGLTKAGKEVYHYSCETSMRVPLLQYYRHHSWFAERHGLAGSYMYQLTDHISGSGFGCKDFKSIPYGGLFYRSFGVPVPSLRFMALREGVTDSKVLAALREKQLRSPDPEVAAFLKSVASDVMDKHANDADFPERMRDKARALLLK